MNIRSLLLMLVAAGLILQAELWLSDNGIRKTHELRRAVAAQREQNSALSARNEALDAEVMNLKNGRAAAEERARTDLGLIGKSETFFQVVPAGEYRHLADADRR